MYLFIILLLQILYASKADKDVFPSLVHVSWGALKSSFIITWKMNEKVPCQLFFNGEYERQQNIVLAKNKILTSKDGKNKEYWYRAKIKVRGKKAVAKISYNIACKTKTAKVSFKSTFKADSLENVPSFMIFGDLSSRSKYIEKIVKVGTNYDAVFHLGDISYNLDSNNGKNGNDFLKLIEDLASKVPYLTIPGDHERGVDGKYTHYSYKFANPGLSFPMSLDELSWYKDIEDGIMIIGLNSEQFMNPVIDRIDWLEQILSRKSFKWKIVLTHQPLYCSQHDWNDDCKEENSDLRNTLEDVFIKYHVDLVISGHIHAYERSWPIIKGKPTQLNYQNPKAPVHVITGSTGNDVISDVITEKSSWSAFSMSGPDTDSYGVLEISEDELSYEQISLKDLSKIDSFTISKGKVNRKVYVSADLKRKNIVVDKTPVNMTYFILVLVVCLFAYLYKRRFRKC